MLEFLVALLVVVIIAAIIGWALFWCISLAPVPDPIKNFLRILVILILLVAGLGWLFGGMPGAPSFFHAARPFGGRP